jgi:hypothetical protein
MEQKNYWHSKLYPSGDWTLGYVSPKKKSKKEDLYDALEKNQCTKHYYETHYYGGTQLRCVEERRDVLDGELYKEYMGLSYPIKSHSPKKRVKRGQKGISSYARKMVRSACALLQWRYGKRRLSFVTLTMPSLPKYAEEIVLTDMGGWSEIVRQTLQEFRRELLRSGGSGEVVGCVEIQEQRYNKYDAVAPHIHLVFEGHKGDWKYYIYIKKCQEIWQRIVENQLRKIGLEDEIDFDESTRIESIKKDAKNYMGKYMSKGGAIVAKIIEDGKSHLLPSSWWICSSNLKKMIKIYTFSLDEDTKQSILNKDKEFIEENFYFCHSISRVWKNQEMSFGYCGRYKDYRIDGKELEIYLK